MKFFSKYFIISLISCILFTNQLVLASNIHSADNEGVSHIRQCHITSTGAKPDGLEWDPLSGGDDIYFDLGNDVCLAVIATSYFAVKAGIAGANISCGRKPRFDPRPSPIKDAFDLTMDFKKAAGNGKCFAGATAGAATLATALGEISLIYAIANDVYTRAHVCGYEWMANNPAKYNRSTPDYKNTVETDITKIIQDGSEAVKRDKLQLLSDSAHKEYREWYYGGVEVEDTSDDGVCMDVTECEDGSHPGPTGSCNSFHPQRYYMHGFQTPNFGCQKYDVRNGQNDPLTGQAITPARLVQLKHEYDCCKSRSSKYICIEYDPVGALKAERKFCKIGDPSCTIKGVTFSVKAISNNQILCAETYSLCPYNFGLDGGSNTCDYYQDGLYDSHNQQWNMVTPDQINEHTKTQDCDKISEIRNADCTYNDKAGKCKNFCQYMNHCVMTDSTPYRYVSGITSPYFADACINFVGDSQNQIAYNDNITSMTGALRHFTAPIAQCMKETLENVFYNRTGHSQCRDNKEVSSVNGTCPSGDYILRKGDQVKRSDGQTASFFSILQNNMQLIVKMFLTLSIMFYGAKILMGLGRVTKKELLMYIVKIGLVLYFATGNAWQTYFFDGVYNSSAVLSKIVFKIKTSTVEVKRDGCQFGDVSDASGNLISISTYPDGKDYLALWDTLDCKISRYLSFGPQATYANLAGLIVAGYFTEPVGVYFATMLLLFGFFLIAAALRALHIFLSSAFSIIIMVYVSPLIIVMALFERTKEIFKNWLTQLISFCIQPMILFAYIALFLNVMDNVLIGSATFEGKEKSVNCKQTCVSNDGAVTFDKGQDDFCSKQGDHIIDPESDSFICITDINNYENFPGFELIGISIPFIKDIFTKNGRQKILTVMKGALVMFILAKFLDEISNVAAALIGGASLQTAGISVKEMFDKTRKLAQGIANRGARGLMKGASKANEKRKEAFSAGNKGKDVERGGGETKADSMSSSGDNKADVVGSEKDS